MESADEGALVSSYEGGGGDGSLGTDRTAVKKENGSSGEHTGSERVYSCLSVEMLTC